MKKKKILVTGASRGIGLSIAQKLLDSGYGVIGSARKTPFGEDLKENPAFTEIICDLENDQAAINILKPLFDNDNSPEVLVNNAAVFEDSDLTEDDTKWLDVWDRTMQVNLRASSVLSKWALSYWIKNNVEGIIINIASRAAYRGDTGEYAAYAASKAGMVAFTKSIYRSVGKYGITAFSIAPGFVKTDMAENSISVYGKEYLTQD
ncbi:MAG: SDR family NAD(P)-dependent oxidoreductase, partial [Balneolaceae bacterium]